MASSYKQEPEARRTEGPTSRPTTI